MIPDKTEEGKKEGGRRKGEEGGKKSERSRKEGRR
jgi:hypothetical protein